MQLLPIENQPGFCRDTDTTAIINTDKGALIEYKNKRKNEKLLKDLSHQVTLLTEELNRIKQHLNLK